MKFQGVLEAITLFCSLLSFVFSEEGTTGFSITTTSEKTPNETKAISIGVNGTSGNDTKTLEPFMEWSQVESNKNLSNTTNGYPSWSQTTLPPGLDGASEDADNNGTVHSSTTYKNHKVHDSKHGHHGHHKHRNWNKDSNHTHHRLRNRHRNRHHGGLENDDADASKKDKDNTSAHQTQKENSSQERGKHHRNRKSE